MVRRGRSILPVLTLFGVLVAGAPASAEEPAPEWSYALSSELMSPYCPGRALPDCPSPQATELRRWIVDQARDGRTKDEVMSELLARFGEQMLQRPRAQGFGLAAYAIPGFGMLAGLGLLTFFLRRQRAATAPWPLPPPTPVDADLEREVDEEFRRAQGGQ